MVNINKCIPDCTKEAQKYKYVIEYKNQCVENCNSLDDGYELKESNGKCFKKCLEERKYFDPDSNEYDNKCDRTKIDRYEVSSLTVNYVCKKSCSIKNKYLKNDVCEASCSNSDRIGKGNECKSGCDDEQDGKYYYNIWDSIYKFLFSCPAVDYIFYEDGKNECLKECPSRKYPL